ncbi:MAG: hypothetical protein QOD80_543, partial [Verrucomicrobiota bacterium]
MSKSLGAASLFIAVTIMFYISALAATACVAAETISIEAAKTVLEFEQAKDPDRQLTWNAFTQNYTVTNGRVEKADLKEFLKSAGRDMAKVREALLKQTGFLGMKIRAEYSDVLSSEDPTVTIEGKEVVQSATDLKGASFSFKRDLKGDADTWIAKGALLFPFLGRTTNVYPRLGDPMRLTTYGAIPSISFDRETDEADATKNVNSLIFRVGAFAKFMSGGIIRAQTFRFFAAYGTDFSFNTETPAVQFEYEPVVFLSRRLGTGSTHSLLERSTPSGESETFLAYQLRAYVHGEYGTVTDSDNSASVPETDFFRWGPKCELTFDPLFTDRFSATFSYQHFVNIIGDSDHNHLFKASLEYRITTKDDVENDPNVPLMSLKATYENGGVDLTNAKVRTVFV